MRTATSSRPTELTVTDDNGASATDQVTVAGAAPNPFLNLAADPNVTTSVFSGTTTFSLWVIWSGRLSF
ncbi:MAG: hypothetical protein IPH00_16090 [Flavobacteriales bacterium]|nr:hypothetical protein [Flavobacteriales bacterium]